MQTTPGRAGRGCRRAVPAAGRGVPRRPGPPPPRHRHRARRPPLRRPAARPRRGGARRRAPRPRRVRGPADRHRPRRAWTRSLRVDAAVLGNDVARRLFELDRAARAHLEPAARQPRARRSTRCWPGTTRRCRTGCSALAGRLAAVPGSLAAARGRARPDAEGPPGDRDRPVRRDDRPGHRGGERRPAPGGQRRRGLTAQAPPPRAVIAEVERRGPPRSPRSPSTGTGCRPGWRATTRRPAAPGSPTRASAGSCSPASCR